MVCEIPLAHKPLAAVVALVVSPSVALDVVRQCLLGCKRFAAYITLVLTASSYLRNKFII